MSGQDTLIERLKKGLDGVTPGPWEAVMWSDPQWAVKIPNTFQFVVLTSQGNDEPNAEHIALCSPDNIRLLLGHIASLQSRLARAEAALEVATEMLDAFAPLTDEGSRVRRFLAARSLSHGEDKTDG